MSSGNFMKNFWWNFHTIKCPRTPYSKTSFNVSGCLDNFGVWGMVEYQAGITPIVHTCMHTHTHTHAQW